METPHKFGLDWLSDLKMLEDCGGTDKDGRYTEHGYTIRSPGQSVDNELRR